MTTNEHESTDATDDESADEDSNVDDDLTREDVPAMDGNILQPVEDAVMTPSPAGNPQRKAASPRKIAKVRRRKRKNGISYKMPSSKMPSCKMPSPKMPRFNNA